MKRILIVKLRPLGDCILAGTCFEAVREAFPKAWITALVQPPAQGLYRKSGWVNEVLAYSKSAIDGQGFLARFLKNRRMAEALRARRFDLALDLSASHRSAQLVRWARPGMSLGLGHPELKGAYDVQAKGDDEASAPPVELDKRVLRLAGIAPKPHDREGGWWRVPGEAFQYADLFWKANRFGKDDLVVAVNPFASCESKEWYPAKWAAVIREALDKGLKVFLTCAPLERRGVAAIQKELGRAFPVYSGRDLLHLMGLYRRSAAVVSVDSGPRHLAASVGTPTVTVWGPEPVGKWHPYSRERHPVVLKEVPCRPCGLRVCVEKKHECMAQLEPREVLQALKGTLKRSIA